MQDPHLVVYRRLVHHVAHHCVEDDEHHEHPRERRDRIGGPGGCGGYLQIIYGLRAAGASAAAHFVLEGRQRTRAMAPSPNGKAQLLR
eukprot:11624-Prymnesium_polylepis.2